MVQLELLSDGKAIWHGRKYKIGNRAERHSLRRFVMNYAKTLPILVLISKLGKHRDFAFAPVLINGQSKNVVFLHKIYIMVMSFDDVVEWIQNYIQQNQLYLREECHYYI